MINGELIVDNFAGGTGKSESAGVVQGRATADMQGGQAAGRGDRTAKVCLKLKFKLRKE